MKITIKHRRTDNVLFEGDYDSTKEAVMAALKDGADLHEAYLRGADLRWADLRGAYLREADLRWADLGGAKINNDVEISLTPYQLDTENYHVYIWDKHIKIGCEFHSMDDWFGFDDSRILTMDNKKGLEWWRIWKEPIKAICLNTGRWTPTGGTDL